MGTAAIAIDFGIWKRRLGTFLASCQRSMKARAERPLQVEQTTAIGAKGTVALLSVDGRRVLVGVTGGCIRFHTIKSIDLPLRGTVR